MKEITKMPDYGKIIFVKKEKKDLKNVFSNATLEELKFIGLILKYG